MRIIFVAVCMLFASLAGAYTADEVAAEVCRLHPAEAIFCEPPAPPTPDHDVSLVIGDVHEAEYVFDDPDTPEHTDTLTIIFDGSDQSPVTFSAEAWDMDTWSEVMVSINGHDLDYFSKKRNDWGPLDTFAIASDKLVDGVNVITLKNKSLTYTWGVRNMVVAYMSDVPPPPEPNEPNQPPPPPEPDPDDPPLPDIEVLDTPYYGERQPDIVERVCGDNPDSWPTYELKDPAHSASAAYWLKKQKNKGRILVYWHPEQYPSLTLDGPGCAALVGVPGPDGELPLTVKSGSTVSGKNPTRQGGIYIEGIAFDMSTSSNSGDCIGMPNNRQFVILKNLDVRYCRHHALVTSRARSMYMEITDSTFRKGGTHNLYIDSVAAAVIDGVKSFDPGWGHALRCIAGTCLISDIHVSNVKEDGTFGWKPKGSTGAMVPRIGMHPLEVYNQGTGHRVTNARVDFYRSELVRGSSMASHFRNRDSIWGSDSGYHDDKQWHYFQYGSPEWEANTDWTLRTLVYDSVTVNCLGDYSCHAITTWGTHPIANDAYKAYLSDWIILTEFEGETIDELWTDMREKLQSAVLPYPTDWFLWTVDQTLPHAREAVLRGKLTNKVPVRPHPLLEDVELGRVTITNLTYNNGYDDVVRPVQNASHYCWSGMKYDDIGEAACPDIKMPAAEVIH